jgi:hypothetical protein
LSGASPAATVGPGGVGRAKEALVVMERRNAFAAASLIAALAACGGSGAGGTPTPAATIHVAGSYDVRKTVTEDTCGLGASGDVVTNPATVQHATGATDFVLNDHGTRDLPGTVRADGSFDLRPLSSVVMGTIPATDTFDGGRFTATGFAVRNTTALQASPVAGGPAGPCHVVAAWEGTKQGAPNVIP